MAVGGVKGGGGKGAKAGGAKGSSGGAAAKSPRVEAADGAEATEAAVGGSSETLGPGLISGLQNVDRMLSPEFCAHIAKTVPNWEAQVKALVAEVLRQNLRIESKLLTDRIADTLQQDPGFKRKLERLLSKGP